MRADAQKQLWDNSVGYLRRDRGAFQQYGVPQKRGILLIGEPGNGKTMACRWLCSHCEQLGLAWSRVTAERYEKARKYGQAEDLFELSSPGIVLFDDVDLAVRDRRRDEPTSDHSIFLAELDGMRVHQGVVYLFTTNATLDELDSAFLRPGRIDVVTQFPKPDGELRRRLVLETWHQDIRDAVNVDEVAACTEGLSFAEMEELRKLLVLRFLDTQKWDWPGTLSTFRQDDRRVRPVRRVGFVGHQPDDFEVSLGPVF
jgi:ATP-dependent 26S proteasome regulatory subunit